MSRLHAVLTGAVNSAIGLLAIVALFTLHAQALPAQKQPPGCGGLSAESCYIIETCSRGFESDGRTCTSDYARYTWYYSSRR